ncbi:hypothetical protein EG856_03240 [Mycoplasmopsis phocirhinis]|uniref:Septation ring formation regulator EzrA n=1 Tax=Mycoplasmopsis phocirhinis TaxID=142650 RepID=A0A4P6MT74_9BACT|nr:hypothetical protein [Mycoplasmopsis phocirhinis]QBF34904.1 hypothetical protein EG856_03240 [Mycoplasmopsis phocirhinis]
MKHNFSQNTIILISLMSIFLLLILSLLITSFVFLARKNILQRYRKNTQKWYEYITKNYNYAKTQTIRFKELANINSVYDNKYQKLKELLNNSIHKSKQEYEKEYSDIVQTIKKTNIKKSKSLYLTLNKKYQNFYDFFNKVLSETKQDNLRYEINDLLLTNAQAMLKDLERKLNINKQKLVRSYHFLSEELQKYKIKFSGIEESKKNKSLNEITEILSENDRKLRMFASKISHALVMEKLIFSTLVNMFKKTSIHQFYPAETHNLVISLAQIQKNYLTQPFQNTSSEIKKLLHKYYLVQNKLNTDAKILNFIDTNFIQIDEFLTKIENKINIINRNKNEIDKIKCNQFTLKLNHLKSNFNKIKQQKQLSKTNIFLDFDSFIEVLVDFTNDLNVFLRQQNETLQKPKYFNNYWIILEQWYYIVLTKRNFLLNTTENDLLFAELIQNYEQLLKNKVNSFKNLDTFVQKLLYLYKKTQKAQIYKYMTTVFLDKISKFSIKSEKINLRLQDIVQKITNKEFAIAYNDALQLIRKEKINVL